MPVIFDALQRLLDSNAVLEALNMLPTDSAFSFFRRKQPSNILSYMLNDIRSFRPLGSSLFVPSELRDIFAADCMAMSSNYRYGT